MNKRITLYTSKENKALIIQAARAQHLSVSSYIRLVALKHAKEDLDIKLNDSDWKSLINELNNPSKPNGALKSIFNK